MLKPLDECFTDYTQFRLKSDFTANLPPAAVEPAVHAANSFKEFNAKGVILIKRPVLLNSFTGGSLR